MIKKIFGIVTVLSILVMSCGEDVRIYPKKKTSTPTTHLTGKPNVDHKKANQPNAGLTRGKNI